MDTLRVYQRIGNHYEWFDLSEHNRAGIISFQRTENTEGEDYFTLRFNSSSALKLNLGSFIEVNDVPYTMHTPPVVKMSNSVSYDHTAIFHSPAKLLENFKLFNTSENYMGDLNFSLYGNLETFLQLVMNNMERYTHYIAFTIGTIPSLTEEMLISFNNTDCLTALRTILSPENFNLDFWFEFASQNSFILHIGTPPQVTILTIAYGEGNGLYEITKEPSQKRAKITRLFVEGGDKNLPSNYGRTRLKMLNNQRYLESEGWQMFNREEYIAFDDIFPRRIGVVSTRTGTNKFTDSSMDFNLNATGTNGTTYLIEGVPAQINFISGNLQGYTFDIISYNHSAREFTLKYNESDYGITMPSTELAYSIQQGDKYVLLNIRMPQEYVDEAEAKLTQKARDYFDKIKTEPFKYTVKLDPLFIERKLNEYGEDLMKVNHLIRLTEPKLGTDELLRVFVKQTDLLNGSVDLTIDYPMERKIDTTVRPVIQLERWIVREMTGSFVGTEIVQDTYLPPHNQTVTIPPAGSNPHVLWANFRVSSENLGGAVDRIRHSFRLLRGEEVLYEHPGAGEMANGYYNWLGSYVYLGESEIDGMSFPYNITEAGVYTAELTVDDGFAISTRGFDINVVVSNE